MKPIDVFHEKIISIQNAQAYLSESEYNDFILINDDDKILFFHELLEKPIDRFTPINELYFRSKWAELVNIRYGEKPITLLEIASGDADMIPQALSRSNPKSKYITANMNVALNESLINKTKDLNLDVQLFDDDAKFINKYVSAHSVDMIAFQHGVNDVLQAILCGQNGVDTIYCNWMSCLPKMIELLKIEVSNHSFESNVKQPFLALISDLMSTLKNGGILAINHYMFKLDLDWGYPADLFENLILIIRKWFNELDYCTEITIDGFDEQWWIFLTHK